MPKIISANGLQDAIIADAIPSPFHSVLRYVLEKLYAKPSIQLLSVSALTVLWSASKGFLSLMDGMNATVGISYTGGYIKRHLTAIIYFLTLSCCLILILSLLVFSDLVRRFLLHYFPASGRIFTALFHFRGVIAFIFLTGLFSLIYRFFPVMKFRFIDCLQVGTLTSAGWVLFSFGFSVYVNHISNIGRFYGSIGLLLLAGIWLRICISLLLYGTLYLTAKVTHQYRPIKILKQLFRQ